MAQASISSLGPFVRLEGISITQLPPGGHGLSPSKSHETDTTKADQSTESLKALDLQTFAARVLGEALPFIDSVAPKSRGSSSWKAKGTPKTFSSSEAPVHLYERTVSGKDLDQIEGMSHFSADRRDETWFCRKSCHENKADKGTASWDEFVRSFKLHHADSEMAFTPTVIGARKAIDWPVLKNDIEVHGGRWTDIIVVVEEMKHKITPKPLKNRTFPVIQISATLKYTQEFLVVSIPLIDFEKSPYAEYAKDKSLVVAAYTSIERVRVLPENGDIEWIMATASDAKGVLPIWMQNLAVPTAVAKDVDFFMSWIPSQRGKGDKPSPISKSVDEEAVPPPISKSSDGAQEAPPPISKTEPTQAPTSISKNEAQAAPPPISKAAPTESQEAGTFDQTAAQ